MAVPQSSVVVTYCSIKVTSYVKVVSGIIIFEIPEKGAQLLVESLFDLRRCSIRRSVAAHRYEAV